MVTEADSNIIPHGLPGAGGRQQRAGPGGGYSQVLERFMFELDHGFLLHRPTEAHDHGEKDSYPDISGIFTISTFLYVLKLRSLKDSICIQYFSSPFKKPLKNLHEFMASN